jgi:hypothetical protein
MQNYMALRQPVCLMAKSPKAVRQFRQLFVCSSCFFVKDVDFGLKKSFAKRIFANVFSKIDWKFF